MSTIRNASQVPPNFTLPKAQDGAPVRPGAVTNQGGQTGAPDDFVDRPTGGSKPSDNPSLTGDTGLTLLPGILPPTTTPKVPGAPVSIEQSVSPGLAIPDRGEVSSTLEITQDVTVSELSLDLDIPHSWKGDLVITLTSPSGTTAVVQDRQGGSADDVRGSFDLSAFKGESAKGQWTLTVQDRAARDVGTLESWGVKLVGEPQKREPSGPPIVVVLDGGADYRHSDLDDSMWVNPNETPGDGVDDDGNGIADDVHGFNVGGMHGDPMKGQATDHGTHVAGIIAAEDNDAGSTGFAAGKAQVMSIGGLYEGDLLVNFERAVDYMVQQKEAGANIRVANASFGDSYKEPADVERWYAAVQKLADADILLVAATANGRGSNMNDVPDMPANIDLPNVLTVAAMDRNNDRLAGFSSHGDRVVELAAVGESVLSTVPGDKHRTMSGTSMATPTVAAAAALIFATNPDLTAADARRILVESVELDEDLVGKVSTGGKLDIAAAVAAAEKTLEEAPASVARAGRNEWFLAS